MGELIAAGGLHLLGFFQKLVPVVVVAHGYLNAQIALWTSSPFAPQFGNAPQAESPFFCPAHLTYNLLDASLMHLVVR